jgi:hypothetical protein
MDLDFALVRFEDGSSATETFAAGRDRFGADAPWTRQIGFVEHHHSGHLVLRGTSRRLVAGETAGLSPQGSPSRRCCFGSPPA